MHHDQMVRYPDVLIYSRTVVERDQSVTTGVLTYAEGDILEIEIHDNATYQLGEPVKVTIYSPVRLITFTTTVVAKGADGIIILHPPDIRARFGEKRVFPRVMIDQIGTITNKQSDIHSSEALALIPSACKIKDISLGGIGLIVPVQTPMLVNSRFAIQFELTFKLNSMVEIIREEEKEDAIIYGAKFINIDSKTMQSLRAFILVKQLEEYYAKKKTKPTPQRRVWG